MCDIKWFKTKYFLCGISLSTGTDVVLILSILGHCMVLVSVVTQYVISKNKDSERMPELFGALLTNIILIWIDIFAIYGKLKDKLILMTPFMVLQVISTILTLLSAIAVPLSLILTKFPAGIIVISFLLLVASFALQYHFTSVVFSYYVERKISLLSGEPRPLLQPATA